MTISFTAPMLQKLSEAVGFEVKSTTMWEDDLRIYGENDEFAEATLFIDFGSRSVYGTIYFATDSEKKFRIDF